MPGPEVVGLLQSFAVAFTRPTFAHAVVLRYGAILAPGRRTVAAALRAVGLRDERHFTSYHRVLNRTVWSPLRLSGLLLELIVTTLLPPHAPVILLVDATLARRTGRRIVWKGRFHDAVRSQTGHVATSEGIHWLCLAVLMPVPWSRRPWALPFLSVPTLTPATSAKLGRRHRTTRGQDRDARHQPGASEVRADEQRSTPDAVDPDPRNDFHEQHRRRLDRQQPTQIAGARAQNDDGGQRQRRGGYARAEDEETPCAISDCVWAAPFRSPHIAWRYSLQPTWSSTRQRRTRCNAA